MKQFGILGDLTPFEPANPALDIPDGDPLELKKVTDQSMNAFYGELANAITKSGQILTPPNGTSPNSNQLWTAISSGRVDLIRGGTPTSTTTAGQVFTNSLSLIAPCDGVAIVSSYLTVADKTIGQYQNVIQLNLVDIAGTSGFLSSSVQYKLLCTKGTSYALSQKIAVTASGTSFLSYEFSYIFLAGA